MNDLTEGMKRWSLLLALSILFVCLAPLANGTPQIHVSTAFWIDPQGKASIEEAKEAPFQSYEGPLTRGYTSSTLWVRLRISGGAALEPLAIVVRPAFLRHIELYDPSPASGNLASLPLMSGRDIELTENNHIGLDNGFIIGASAEPLELYLRIATTTTLTADIQVKRLSEAKENSRLTAGAVIFYCAFLLAFCLWACVNWIIRRDWTYGLFLIRLIFSILHIFVILGPLRYYFANTLDAPQREVIFSLVMTCMPLTAVFDVRLLSDFGGSQRIKKIALIFIALSSSSILLLYLGRTQTALYFTSMIVNAIMLFILVLAFSVKAKENKPHAKLATLIIRAGFAVLVAVVIVPMLMYQNIVNAGVSVLNIFFTHAIISTIILFSLLSIRAHQKDLQAAEFRLNYELKTQQLEQENQKRVEKERLLSMLTHELRNPLTVVRLRTDAASPHGQAVQKAVTDIAKVIERVEQSEKVVDENAILQKTSIGLRRFLEEIALDQGLCERMILDVPNGLVLVTDEHLLASIFRNLLDNVDKYSPALSPFSISAEKSRMLGRDVTTLRITNVVGEAGAPDAEKVFSKYYRNKKAQRKPGSGLGLFLVAGWVKLLGGAIDCSHQADRDGRDKVTFSFWVPE